MRGLLPNLWFWIRRHAAFCSALSSSLIAGMVYGSTLAPDLTWAHHGADGGDLAAAILTGGIPHPPGAPLYLWLGDLFLRLPFANPAYALNVLSALSAAGASGLIAFAVARGAPQQLRMPAAWITGLGLAFSPLLWSQAVIIELYAPAALAAAVIVVLALWPGRHPSRALWLGLAQGAGIAMHPSLALLLPLSLAWLRESNAHRALSLVMPSREAQPGFDRLNRRFARFPASILFALGLVLGLLPYASLPLRAASGAPVNWGHATDLQNWWWLVSGRLYQGYMFAVPLSHLPARLSAWAGLILTQFTVAGALLACIGMQRIWRGSRSMALAMGASLLGLSALAIGYDTQDSHIWLIPAMVVLAYALGRGFLLLLDHVHAAWRLPVALSLAIGLVAWLLVSNWQAIDASGGVQAREFMDRILQDAPSDALLITQQDRHTFSLWYAIYGLGQRQDLEIIDQDLWGHAWYQDVVHARVGAALDLDHAAASTARPVCRLDSSGEMQCD
jgi:hypothetical protein